MKLILYSKDNCSRCKQIIKLIKNKGDIEKLKILKLGIDFTREEFKNKFQDRLFPIIYMNNLLYSYELFIDIYTNYYNTI